MLNFEFGNMLNFEFGEQFPFLTGVEWVRRLFLFPIV